MPAPQVRPNVSYPTGTLPVVNGGTGLASVATGNVLYATGSNALAAGTPDAAGLVDKASTQTIAGAKTFGSSVAYNNGSSTFYTGGRTGGGQVGLYVDSAAAPTYPRFFLDSIGRFYLNPSALSTLDATTTDAAIVVGGRPATTPVAIFRCNASSTYAHVWQSSGGTAVASVDPSGNVVSSATISPGTYTVATLPTPGTARRMAYASNGRKNGEGAAAGTGVIVFDDGVAWRSVDTGATVAA